MAAALRLVVLLLLIKASLQKVGIQKDFVGWGGESYDPVQTWGLNSGLHIQRHMPINGGSLPNGGRRAQPGVTRDKKDATHVNKSQPSASKQTQSGQWIEQLSWEPRSFVFHSFLTNEECDHIISTARPLVRRSTVVIDDKGGVDVDNIRTSYGTFMPRYVDDVITSIEERVANWTKIPVSHQEDMNILRYGIGQKYGAHYDTFREETPRQATVLLYLSDVEEGGETAFPLSNKWIDPTVVEQQGPLSDCAEGHIAVKPKKGDALLFFSLLPGGSLDQSSFHTGCPVIRGIKWTATIWIHTRPFRSDELDRVPTLGADIGLCKNVEESCEGWAEQGACKENKEYMAAYCARSCHFCVPCAHGDIDCYKQNRLNAGFPSIEDVY